MQDALKKYEAQFGKWPFWVRVAIPLVVFGLLPLLFYMSATK